MPIYEYQCDDCNHVLDALQKVSDKPLVDCPECGKTSLRRLISAPNFRLKGEGWYETDFKKENRKNVADQKDEKPEEWMFYRNPFLDPSVYAFWILTDEEKELLLH